MIAVSELLQNIYINVVNTVDLYIYAKYIYTHTQALFSYVI